ncbi:MAG: TetR/AcrR family transcriptional regulator [Dehalococcoidia bacterium]|nr:TetR/AcrR family transcriptional regulator [Dehalococcoidia bacterium]
MGKEKISLRQKHAIATRQAISQAGASLLSKKGYYNVTVDEICEKAQVSRGTFYKYFKSKDEIIWYEYLKLDQYYGGPVAEAMAKEKKSAGKLLLLCNAAAKYTSSLGVSNVKAAYQSQLGPDRGFSLVASEKRPLYALTWHAVAEGQSKGEFRNDIGVDEMTRTWVTALRGAVFEWCLNSGKYDLVAEAARLCSTVVEGMRQR